LARRHQHALVVQVGVKDDAVNFAVRHRVDIGLTDAATERLCSGSGIRCTRHRCNKRRTAVLINGRQECQDLVSIEGARLRVVAAAAAAAFDEQAADERVFIPSTIVAYAAAAADFDEQAAAD
jgi:hypothetical protein